MVHCGLVNLLRAAHWLGICWVDAFRPTFRPTPSPRRVLVDVAKQFGRHFLQRAERRGETPPKASGHKVMVLEPKVFALAVKMRLAPLCLGLVRASPSEKKRNVIIVVRNRPRVNGRFTKRLRLGEVV
jgi:hypothetical protein